MDEQNLVFSVEYDAGKFNAAADEIAGRELALENRVLEMVAKTAHEFEDFAETAVVGDVVTDEIGLAHLVYLRVGRCRERSTAKSRKVVKVPLISMRVSTSIRLTDIPSLDLGRQTILSVATQLGDRMPLISSGNMEIRTLAVVVSSDVIGHTVTNSISPQWPFCGIMSGPGLPA